MNARDTALVDSWRNATQRVSYHKSTNKITVHHGFPKGEWGGHGTSSSSRHFCAGADLGMLARLLKAATPSGDACPATARRRFLAGVERLQDMCTSLELCTKPVVAVVHGCAYGAAIDLVTAADVVITTADAKFCVKEVDLAVTADLGTLQRLPRLVGAMRAKELTYS